MKTRHVMIPALTQVMPGTVHYAEIDTSGADGGTLVIRIKNGNVGPTSSAVATLLAAFDEAAAEWVRIARFDGSTTSNADSAWATEIPRDASMVRVTVSAHTGAAVECSARAVLRGA